MFWKYAANIQESTYAKVWFQKSCKATLLKSYFGIGVLLYICCIFSKYHFLKTPLEGCFWIAVIITTTCRYMMLMKSYVNWGKILIQKDITAKMWHANYKIVRVISFSKKLLANVLGDNVKFQKCFMFSSFNYSSFKYIILVKVAQNLLSLYFTDIETWRKQIDVEPFELFIGVLLNQFF